MAKNITKLRHRLPNKFRHLLSAIRNILTGHWPLYLLLGLIATLAFLNYQPGTWLTGWDNLHPEFNFLLNLKNSLFSVWQERGPGFLVGMSPAADFPRIIFLFLTSQILNIKYQIIRYFWTFLMLALGPIATYFLLHHVFLKTKFDSQTKRIASFLGALFYLLNLATVQYFFIPFESFTAFFAFFPLLILATTLYLEKASLRHHLFLLIVSLLAAPAFFVQTLFVVLTLCLLPILIHHFRHGWKKPTILLLTFFLTQSYWLLPQIFFVATHAGEVALSHINLLSSPETLFRNLQFANIKDLALLKGFWFNILDPGTDNKFDYLFLVWRNHLSNPVIITIGLISFALVITGIVYSLKKKLPFAGSFFTIFLICNFFLLGGVFLVGEEIPILGELFRSPFTKFSIPLAFTYAVFFSVGVIFLFDIFSFLHHRLTYLLTLFTVSIALVIFTTPAFTGNLISPQMRVNIPDEYFELFDFFKTQDTSTRIANFPQYVLWGWNYYSWGYRGAGLLWYGIRQPIMDRGFDVWEKSSQNYYEEINTALYSEDQAEFENLIDKYAINWLLIDKNVIAPSENIDLGLIKLQRFIDNSGKFTPAKNIDDKILIYKTNVDQSVKNFLSVGARRDAPTHPFADLSLRPISPDLKDNQIQLTTQYSIANDSEANAAKQITINIPSYSQTETLTPNIISYRKTGDGFQLKFEPILPSITLDGEDITSPGAPLILDFALPPSESGLILGINDQYLEIQLPDELTVQTTFYPVSNLYLPSRQPIRISVYSNSPSQKLDLATPFAQVIPAQCYTNKPNRKIEKIVTGKTISLLGTDLVGCLATPIPATDLNHLLSLEFTYQSSTRTPANASITNRALGGENSPQALSPKSQPTFTRVFAKPLLEPMQANLILEANESKSTQEITYQNPAISYLPLLAESTFTLPPIPEAKYQISNVKSQMISVSLPIIDNPLTLVVDQQNNLLNPSPGNCDNFNTGEVDRLTTEKGFLYTSQNANSCDQINLKHLPHEINYAILADIETQKGLSPTICLENYSTRRCDVFERLIDPPAGRQVAQQIIIQPIRNHSELPGYTLHLSNQSFGNRPTQNLIKSLTIAPFPLQFLKNITLETSEKSQISNIKYQMDSTHPAEFLYTLTVKDISPYEGETERGLLNLYQTRSPHWKALEISEADLKLPLWALIAKLPLLYLNNNKLPSITTSNANDSWHNIWQVPGSVSHIAVFYLPQYLEFLGFLLLPLPIIGAIFHLLTQKIKEPRQTRSQKETFPHRD